MKITHIVLFKFKPTSSPDDIKACFLRLAQLSQQMPEIQSFAWGKYSSQEGLNQGFSYGFTMTFATEADRDCYLTHPEHVRLAQFIQNHIEFPSGVIAFDSPLESDVVNKAVSRICVAAPAAANKEIEHKNTQIHSLHAAKL